MGPKIPLAKLYRKISQFFAQPLALVIGTFFPARAKLGVSMENMPQEAFDMNAKPV